MWPFGSKVTTSVPLGVWGEQTASRIYEQKGYAILSRNEFNRRGLRLGEIDFIATTKTDIAFVEVKTRSQADSRFGSPADSVNKSKQQKLLRAVHGFLARNPGYYNLRPHVDVCTIVLTKLDRGDYSAKIIENSVEDWF